jgi:iron(III) transport system substrate-binding protein
MVERIRGGWPAALATALLVLGVACGGGASGSRPQGSQGGGASGAPSKPQGTDVLTYAAADRQQVLEAGARQEGSVGWYTSLTIGVAEALVRAFEAQYPGVKVELWRAAGNDIITKVTEETRAGKGIADVLETPIPETKVLQDAGVLTPYYLPNASTFPEQAKDVSGQNIYWAVDREHYISFGYNTQLLDPTLVPKDWNGLLAPGLKDKMALVGTNTGVNFIGYALQHLGPDYLNRLAQQNVKVQMISGTAMLDLIAKGEIASSPGVFQAEVTIAKGKGAPVEWVMIPPVTTNAGVVSIVKQAQHPHAAALLAAFLLGDEGQRIFRENYFGSASSDPGFPRWYPDVGLTAAQYEQKNEEWKKLLTEKFVRSN